MRRSNKNRDVEIGQKCLTCGKVMPPEYVAMYKLDRCRECLQREIDAG